MSDKKNINENELDELLKSLPLWEVNDVLNQDLAEFVMTQDYKVKVNPAKEIEMLNKFSAGKPGFGGFGLFLSMLIVTTGLTAFTYFSYLPTLEKNKIVLDEIKIDSAERIIKNKTTWNEQAIKTSSQQVLPKDTFGKISTIPIITVRDTINVIPEEPRKTELKQEPALPFVTESDRVKYRKIKLMMLAGMIKPDKNLYSHVEADKMLYNGKNFITDAYNMRKIGITNLEYKTFLADLVEQGRTNDYFAANVVQATWAMFSCSQLSTTYFTDEKYNDFPVVNVSIDGAKLFCKWLEEEAMKYMKQNKLKIKPLKVRLPYDYEWLYAARQGYTKVAFETGYTTIFDEKEGLVDKRFDNRTERIKKGERRKDTLYDYMSINHYGWSEKELLDLFNKGFVRMSPVVSDTINTERMKLYNKFGHVSEMIIEKRSEHIWLIGANWKSKEEYLKLENQFSSTKVSPFVGFRPVIINLNDSEYKNPFP